MGLPSRFQPTIFPAHFDADKVFEVVDILQMAARFEYSGDNCVYEGYAPSGTGESEEKWMIIKNTFSGANKTKRQHASGKARFAFNWTARASYSYS